MKDELRVHYVRMTICLSPQMEHNVLVAVFLLSILEVPGTNLGRSPATMTEVLHGFSKFLQANSGIIAKLGQGCFLQHP
jgi:hypothetical protein